MNLRQDTPQPLKFRALAWAIGWWACLGLLAGCDRGVESQARPGATVSRTVLTSFHPLACFADRIAGGRVTVKSLCPTNTDPSLWNPSRSDLQEFQNASLILLNGAGYEQWATAAALPMGRVIVTSRSFESEWLTLPTIIHSHGTGGVHTHSGVDGHTWMDPVQARQQAAEILTAFSQRWPEETASFHAGFDQLAAEFEALESAFREVTPAMKEAVIFTSHPAYGYLARRFGWSTTPLSLPPDALPSAEMWAGVGKAVAAAAPGRRLMLFETEPLPAIRERLQAEWRITAVTFDTCETPAQDGSYFERMQRNVESLRRAVGQAQPQFHDSTP